MPTNWVKEGLDSYLALTGERRAERRAESDLASRQHAQSVQDQQLDLAKSQDQRSAASAGLQNEEAGLRIGEMKRKSADIEKTGKAIRDFITMKTASDPSVPNTLDPAGLAASRQTATDLAHTATMVDQLPAGYHDIPVNQLPASARNVLLEGPGKAALMRKGVVHTDPKTGQKYTMTGEIGSVRVVRADGQDTQIIPNMLAQNEDGTVREVPFSDGTNNPDVPIKSVTSKMLYTRAGATMAALSQAENAGISPAVAYSENIYKMVQALPYEQQVAWLQGEVAKETSRRDKHIADAGIAKAAEPYSKQIEALKGTPEGKRTAAAAIMLGAPSAVVDHLLKTSKSVHEMFPDSKKTYTTVETAEGVYALDQTTGERGKRIGGLKPTSKGEGSDKLPAEAKMIEYMVSGGIAPDKKTAYKMLKTSKESPKALITKLVMSARKSQDESFLKPGSQGYKTDKQLLDEAKSLVDQMSSIPEEAESDEGIQKTTEVPKRPLSSFTTRGSVGAVDTPLSQRFGLTF